MKPIAAWNGQPLGILIAVAVRCDPAGKSTEVAAVAGSDEQEVYLGSDALAAFIKLHQNAQLICYDAAEVHWRLQRAFAATGDRQGLGALWNLSRHCRWLDVMLLEQRWRAVLYGVFPIRKELADLALEYCGFNSALPESLATAQATHSGPDYWRWLAHHARTSLLIYRALLPKVNDLIKDFGLPHTTEEYGPLGLGVDVQAAIAVAAIARNGIQISKSAAEELTTEFERQFAIACDKLATHQGLRACFHWEQRANEASRQNLIRRDRLGFLECNNTQLRKWLRSQLPLIRDGDDGRIVAPLGNDLQPSVNMRHWGVHAQLHAGLSAIRDTASLAAALRALHSPARLELSYDVIPTLYPFRVGADDLRRAKRPIFEPRPGHVFVTAAINELELRCFASLCHTRYIETGSSYFRMLEEGVDVIDQTAAILFNGTRLEPLLSERKGRFERLKKRNPERYAWWLSLARALWKSLAQGLSCDQIRSQLIREGFDLSPKRVIKLRNILVRIVAADFDYFLLTDQTFDHVAEKLGIDPNELATKLLLPDTPTTSFKAFRNVLEGTTSGIPVWKFLEANARVDWKCFLKEVADGKRDPYDLLSERPTAFSGAVGNRVYSTHLRPAECQLLADQIIKMVAYEVIANGYHLVAVHDHEILVEVEEPAGSGLCTLLGAIVEATARKLLAGAAKGCVSCQTRSAW